ncbi:MAG: ABC transporter permease subunit [Pseudomonadota bacterium]
MTDQAISGGSRARPKRQWSFYDKEVQGVIWQIVTLTLVIGIGYWLYSNMIYNLQNQNIRTGFEFLEREAGFAIGESLIDYSAASTYARALTVGLLNTLLVAAIGIVLATVLGVFIGIASLSRNWLVQQLTGVYIHVLRNIPVLLQLLFWWLLLLNDRFTQSAQPRSNPGGTVTPLVGDVYITNSGVYYPAATDYRFWLVIWGGILLALVLGFVVGQMSKRKQAETGQTLPVGLITLGLVIALPLAGWLAIGAPWDWEMPKANRFRLSGGANLSPEFLALLFGLAVYTSAFIAQIVRAGIMAVPKGQTEAARAIGLKEGVIMRQVILPQALRVIIPPTTSQYLNLTKNSSLAVAIGYPDLVNVGNTTLNQTGQAPEAILIMMLVYLTLSLLTSLFMNIYNASIQLVER